MRGSFTIDDLDFARQFYWDNGWVRIIGVYKPDEAEKIAKYATDKAYEEMEKSTDEPYLLDQAADGTFYPRKIDWPYIKHEVFREFVEDERLQKVVSGVLGDKACLIRDQIFLKPPGCGSPKPFHQDNAHFLCTPSDQVISAWVALDRVNKENGCLSYLEGSHKGKLHDHNQLEDQPHNIMPSDITVTQGYQESYGIAEKGDVLLHHSETLHRSGVNKSSNWRRGYATHWVGPSAKSQNDTFKWAYYLFENGKVVSNYPKK